jgi:hypothetical protein
LRLGWPQRCRNILVLFTHERKLLCGDMGAG